jgi:hypothetical protein
VKLFVWRDPYTVSYGTAVLCVAANSLTEARKIAKTARVSHYGGNPHRDGNQLPDKLGPPTRVLSIPCAEIYEWEE